MKIFFVPDSTLNQAISQYSIVKEVARVSIPVEYKGKYYKEVQFRKKNIIGKPGKRVKGILFIDENNAVVDDKRMQKELFSVFYHLEKLFDESFLNNLSRTVITEQDLKREQGEAEFIGEVLEELIREDVEGAEKVKEIVLKLPQMKADNNQAIINFLEKVKLFSDKSISYDEIICWLKPLYLETLMKNFEKIKVIGTGSEYYNTIRKEATKNHKKRRIGVMGSSMSRESAVIEAYFSHLQKVTEVYASVLEMSNSEYIKFLNENEKNMINEMMEKNRIR